MRQTFRDPRGRLGQRPRLPTRKGLLLPPPLLLPHRDRSLVLLALHRHSLARWSPFSLRCGPLRVQH